MVNCEIITPEGRRLVVQRAPKGYVRRENILYGFEPRYAHRFPLEADNTSFRGGQVGGKKVEYPKIGEGGESIDRLTKDKGPLVGGRGCCLPPSGNLAYFSREQRLDVFTPADFSLRRPRRRFVCEYEMRETCSYAEELCHEALAGEGEGRGNGETEGGGTPPAPFNLRGNIFGERWPSWVFYKVVTQVPLIFILAATFWQSALRENIVPPVLSPESFARGGGGILPRLPRCLQCRLYPDQEFHILKVRNLLYSLPWKQGTSSCWLPSMEETRECETKGYKDGPRFSRIRYFLLRATKFLLFAILPTFSRRQFQGRSN